MNKNNFNSNEKKKSNLYTFSKMIFTAGSISLLIFFPRKIKADVQTDCITTKSMLDTIDKTSLLSKIKSKKTITLHIIIIPNNNIIKEKILEHNNNLDIITNLKNLLPNNINNKIKSFQILENNYLEDKNNKKYFFEQNSTKNEYYNSYLLDLLNQVKIKKFDPINIKLLNSNIYKSKEVVDYLTFHLKLFPIFSTVEELIYYLLKIKAFNRLKKLLKYLLKKGLITKLDYYSLEKIFLIKGGETETNNILNEEKNKSSNLKKFKIFINNNKFNILTFLFISFLIIKNRQFLYFFIINKKFREEYLLDKCKKFLYFFKKSENKKVIKYKPFREKSLREIELYNQIEEHKKNLETINKLMLETAKNLNETKKDINNSIGDLPPNILIPLLHNLFRNNFNE